MKCPSCDKLFFTQKQLVSHVAFDHAESDDENLEEEYYEFATWDQFKVSFAIII